MWSLILFLGFLTLLSRGSESLNLGENCTLKAKGSPNFPANFSFGVATSAYQIEGAWNADGKGPSIWDEYTHNHPDEIKDRSNGDIAADSYHRFDLDLKALIDLKVDHYRFSIAWSRIYPNGDISSRNQKGIDHYNSVINKLLQNGIEPMITMYHWDMPIQIQKLGGFTNTLIIDQFVTYANELFENYGDRVKNWITFNEPNMYCKPGYGTGILPPSIKASGVADYICFANTLKAHAVTYRLYRSKYFEKQGGRVGITLDSFFAFSKSNESVDVDRFLQFYLGVQAHPIFSTAGGFPDVMVNDIEKNSLKEGRKKSRLPTLSDQWKNYIRGSADFLGVNYYTSRYVKRRKEPMGEVPSTDRDYDCDESVNSNWPRAISDWLYCVPEGLEGLLKHIRDQYNNVEVLVTENGWSDDGRLEDNDRVRYYKSHLQAVLNAINDGCNITSYSAWSLVDNFEWGEGYTEKFGLYSVNMKSPKRERTPKKSAEYYKKVIRTRTIPDGV